MKNRLFKEKDRLFAPLLIVLLLPQKSRFIVKMMKVKGKWMQLMGMVGCVVWMTSCKQEAAQQMGGASYETMKVATSDKEFTTD